MFEPSLLQAGKTLIEAARARGVRIVTVETCTGGLVSGCLTAVPGASEVFERGFVLYHASAKATGLGVPDDVSRQHGAVSAPVTKALAEGGLSHSTAGASVAVTGYAGPGGGNERDPVGTCYIAAARHGRETLVERHQFSGDRNEVRLAALRAALELLSKALS
jgi:nicotinamide-nucleotide amidase